MAWSTMFARAGTKAAALGDVRADLGADVAWRRWAAFAWMWQLGLDGFYVGWGIGPVQLTLAGTKAGAVRADLGGDVAPGGL